MKRMNKNRRPKRNGNVLVTAVFGIMVLMTVTAIVVDLGYMHNAKAELQRSADAAALAACWEMAQQYANGEGDQTVAVETKLSASGAANANEICNELPTVPDADIEIGYLANFDAPEQFDTSDPSLVRRLRPATVGRSMIDGHVPFLVRI